jgi:hypothetical protein
VEEHDDLFDELHAEHESAPTDPLDQSFGCSESCTCGHGWCQEHGTYHLSEEEELAEVDRRQQMLEMGRHCRGGRRVIKKRIGEGGAS